MHLFCRATLIANVFLYFFFYLAMKIKHSEKIGLVCWICFSLAAVFWSFGMYFFTLRVIDWQLTPWDSRARNEGCVLFNFFDSHVSMRLHERAKVLGHPASNVTHVPSFFLFVQDIWHFLSAFGLFFSSVVILIMDDHLDTVPRSEIKVF